MEEIIPTAKKAKVAGTTDNKRNAATNSGETRPQNGNDTMQHPQRFTRHPYNAGMLNAWTAMTMSPDGMIVPQNPVQPNGNVWQQPGTMPPQNGTFGRPSMRAPPKNLKVKGRSNMNGEGPLDNQGMSPRHGNGNVKETNGGSIPSTTSRHHSIPQAPHPTTAMLQYPMAAAQPYAGQQNGFSSTALPDWPLPLRDRQIFSMMDAQWSLPWSKQVSNNVMYFLRLVQVFVIARPGEIQSHCPLSRHLRGAWKLFVQDNDYSELPGDRYATGLCCPACLQNGSYGTRNFIQFIDFRNEDQLFDAMKEQYQHVKFCQAARNMAPELKKRTRFAEYPSNTIALKAFAEWFCDYIHETESIDRGLYVLRASDQKLKLSENAVVRYMKLKETSDQAFEDIHNALSNIPCRMGKASGVVLASDLTELPSEDPLIEFPFYLLALEFIEIVRVTMENPGHHRDLLKDSAVDSLVLFRCNCCHGESECSAKGRSFVVYQAASNKRIHLVCELIELIFKHLQACSKISPSNKSRLLRVMPRPTLSDSTFFANYFQDRIAEWDEYIKRELDYIKHVDSIVPGEDLALWHPVNDLIEGSESMQSTYAYTIRKRAAPPRLASEAGDNDVIEGFDGASEFVGNRRFRKLVTTHRDGFLSTMNLAEKEAINMKVYDCITRRGGAFRRFDSDGTWRHMTKVEAAACCRSALQTGFASLCIPRPPLHLRRGPGSRVLETEIPPQFDLLSDRKRGSIVTRISIDNEEEDEDKSSVRRQQCPESKCRAVADI